MATNTVDRFGPKLVEKADKIQQRVTTGDNSQPAGGFDSTPLPHAPPGYTIKFTFHRGVDLPFADIGSFSSDPYVFARLDVDLPRRHKQDPPVTFRTPTIHKDKNPIWNCEWVVANVPASGFKLKAFVYDEDPTDHDDKLGLATLEVPSLVENWSDIKEQPFKVKHRFASKRVYVLTNISKVTGHHKESFLYMSVQCLGKTPGDEGGQMYTVGPNRWFKHFSPLLGRLAGVKDSVQNEDGSGKKTSRYNFQAIEMQLTGPVPSEMYHRYVEFKPFVAGMFQARSLRGRILYKALHHQHQRLYNFDRATLHGTFSEPCRELTQKFLEFIQYGQGGRIFTYVLMLDGQFRFTETGKEFGIDLLSKHTMHSDVTSYIAFSGEFFVRRRNLRYRQRSRSQSPGSRPSSSRLSRSRPSTGRPSTECPVEEVDDEGRFKEAQEISTEPADYELFIDNDSGTYRPKAELLPQLKELFASNFPGLHITTLDCNGDAERMNQLKGEQREFKRKQGQLITYIQQSSASSLSISSSEEEELNERSGSGSGKQRGNLSRHVHEMRDVKGQMMRWVEHDGHVDRRKHRYVAGRDRAASMEEVKHHRKPFPTVDSAA